MADYKPKLKNVFYSVRPDHAHTYVKAEFEDGRPVQMFACVYDATNTNPLSRWYPLYYVREADPAFYHNILPGATNHVRVRAEFTRPAKGVNKKAQPQP